MVTLREIVRRRSVSSSISSCASPKASAVVKKRNNKLRAIRKKKSRFSRKLRKSLAITNMLIAKAERVFAYEDARNKYFEKMRNQRMLENMEISEAEVIEELVVTDVDEDSEVEY